MLLNKDNCEIRQNRQILHNSTNQKHKPYQTQF